MDCFGIRHKPSGLYLPEGEGRRGRGFTWVEPKEGLPRLFLSARSAKIALTWWLKGQVDVRATASSWESPDILDDEDWKEHPVESRKAEDMEIIPLRLIVRGLS